MGIASLFHRVKTYAAKTVPFGATSGPIVQAQQSRQASNYAVAASQQFGRQTNARIALGIAGVSPLLYGAYMGAAEEAAKKKKKYSGLTLQNELAALQTKYTAWGLNPAQTSSIIQGAF
jgi:hypothetical protein